LVALCGGLLAELEPDAERIIAAVASCERAQRDEFSREHDHFKLVGQDNVRRYRPFETVCVRVHNADSSFELFVRVCAAQVAGCHVTVSVPPDASSAALTLLKKLTESWADKIDFIGENDEQLMARIRGGKIQRIRYAAPDHAPLKVLRAAGEAGCGVISVPVSAEGRLEMLWYLREQSISTDYHRYGNLGRRTNEPRADIL
jgi:RHH-type proline utilization regulon transcriptional repressor/proline dehydrogenase/delta 1-pyrroline-5-carboxylate dehydrogenase